MKKIALLMALLLALSGCVGSDPGKSGENEEGKQGQTRDEAAEEEKVVFSDIKYEDVKNKKQFKGFSESQIKELNENGFLVLEAPDNGYIQKLYHSYYEMANYSSKPTYISSDAVLNAFSIFYNGSMVEFEVSEFYLASAEMANRLSDQLMKEYKAETNPELKALLGKALTYTYTASGLFFHEVEDIDVDRLFNAKIANRYNAELAKHETLKNAMPSEIKIESDLEYDKISKAEGFAPSKLFGYDIDYSQFKPRGHYTMGPSMRNYFLGQMWLSNPGFELEGDNEENKKVALILAASIHSDESLKSLWKKMYDVTSYYSSESDDITFMDLEPIIVDVLKFQDKKYQGILDAGLMKKVDAEIAKLPEPKVVPVTYEGSRLDLSTKKQFRFMGQRYNADQFIFTGLSKPLDKPEVSSFEFFDVLGNRKAGEIAETLLNPYERWDGYEKRLKEVKKLYAENKETIFKNDLYHEYLKAIEIALNHKVDKSNPNVPNYMKSDKYPYLKINTALGAFAQLKHANVLYSKQMMAEMGAPEELVSPHYLDPNVELYEQLSKMVDDAIVRLEQFEIDEADYSAENQRAYLKQFSETLKRFVEISKKELAGELLTDEELLFLGHFGGLCDAMYSNYQHLDLRYGLELKEAVYGQPLISDIATVENRYLELATGLPLEIYVLVNQNGEKVLAKGILFSSYEFYSDKRMNDEEWLDALVVRDEYNGIVKKKKAFRFLDVIPYAKEFVNAEENKVEFDYETEFRW